MHIALRLGLAVVSIVILRYLYVFMLENGAEMIAFVFFVGGVRALWVYWANFKDNLLKKANLFDNPLD